MRSQKSRSRGKNRGNNNRPQGNIINRVFDSSGPEGKVRGTPQQIIDKYQGLYRDAQLSGDRVAAESFAQYAEHYLRLLAEANREQEARREQQEAQHAQQQREREEREAARAAQRQSEGGGQEETPKAERSDESSNQSGRRRRSPRKQEAAAGEGDQPDVIDLEAKPETGLVETVETAPKPARKPRTRKPKADPAPDDGAETPAAE